MFSNRFFLFGFPYFLFLLQTSSALSFGLIPSPVIAGESISIQWVLNGSEPLNGWELWFGGDGSAIKLTEIPPLVNSTVVSFPGSNGTFRAMSGLSLLARSEEVDVAPGATSFSSSSSVVVGTTASSLSSGVADPPPTSTPSSGPKRSDRTTAVVLGITTGLLAVIAVIVLASVAICIFRRRLRRLRRSEAAFEKFSTTPDAEGKFAAPEISAPYKIHFRDGFPPQRSSSLPVANFPRRVSFANDSLHPQYLVSRLRELAREDESFTGTSGVTSESSSDVSSSNSRSDPLSESLSYESVPPQLPPSKRRSDISPTKSLPAIPESLVDVDSTEGGGEEASTVERAHRNTFSFPPPDEQRNSLGLHSNASRESCTIQPRGHLSTVTGITSTTMNSPLEFRFNPPRQ
ncbi:hypothetical protein R3P38DRAFT_162791 [Favolaschia claudopus]|uniref:Uncharacterized protein n=1 Tax=Favolaschia claudopus TaxID=2862362 RepID=A0AAW0CYF9_9AGAR